MKSRVFAVAASVALGGAVLVAAPSQSAGTTQYVVAVGDIAAAPTGPHVDVASLTKALDPDAVLLLGDIAYNNGSNSNFAKNFLPSWQSVINSYPSFAIPGNHEYKTKNAKGYRNFVASYSLPQTGNDLWWVKNLGSYTLIGLDSEGIGSGKKLNAKGKRQMKFLTAALASANGRPTIVTWHRPRFSSGEHGNQKDIGVKTLWNIVSADKDVKLVLWAHDHDFEKIDKTVGGRTLTTMVVGTGGGEDRECPAPGCYAHVNGAVGLKLSDNSIDWAFRSTQTSGKGKVLTSGTISW